MVHRMYSFDAKHKQREPLDAQKITLQKNPIFEDFCIHPKKSKNNLK